MISNDEAGKRGTPWFGIILCKSIASKGALDIRYH